MSRSWRCTITGATSQAGATSQTQRHPYLLDGPRSKGVAGRNEDAHLFAQQPERNLGQICRLADALARRKRARRLGLTTAKIPPSPGPPLLRIPLTPQKVMTKGRCCCCASRMSRITSICRLGERIWVSASSMPFRTTLDSVWKEPLRVPSSFSRTERHSLSAMSAATFLPTRCMRICGPQMRWGVTKWVDEWLWFDNKHQTSISSTHTLSMTGSSDSRVNDVLPASLERATTWGNVRQRRVTGSLGAVFFFLLQSPGRHERTTREDQYAPLEERKEAG